MQARILNQSEEHPWSKFVQNHPLGTIHQAPQWGHFQEKVEGRGKYWIVVVADTKNSRRSESMAVSDRSNNSGSSSMQKILAGALLIRHRLPKGYCWLYAPRGPLLDYDPSDNYRAAHEQMSALMTEITKIAKEEKAIFLRVDPLICARAQILPQKIAKESHSIPSQAVQSIQPGPPTASFCSLLHFPHFRQGVHGFQPDHTLILDLTESEQDLLAQMKPKGRYNIKLAEKKGVLVRKADPSNQKQFQKDLKSFYKILAETTSRDSFKGHDENFYKNMIENLPATLYLAEYDNQIIAACLNTYFKDTATYYYGASSNLHRNLMATYLLHWQAIKDARRKGCKYYDFFGIAPLDGKNHPWQGVTEFKKKFGGQEISYQKPQEYAFKKSLYLLYRAYKKFR